MKTINTTIRITFQMLLFLVMGAQLKAQQVPLFNQYYNNNFLAYPSTAGFNEEPRLSLIYRGQWSGLEGSPAGYALNYTSRLGKDMGFGLTIQNNEIGVVNQTRVSGGISYSFYSENKHSLSIGALTSLSFFSINQDRISPETQQDEILQRLINNNGLALSFDFSVSYRYGDNLQIDFAVPTLINESLSDDEFIQINEDNIPDYLAGIRYRIALDPVNQIYFTPNVTWRYREVIGSEFDILGRIDYKDKISLSGGYRNNYGATVGFGWDISERIRFSYHYDFGQSDIPFLSDGFNEIGLHFKFKRNEEKWNARMQEGAAVIQRLKNEGVYDRNLIEDEDERLASDYLYSQQEGKKKERREKAEARFDDILDEIKQNELAKLEAAALERKRVEEEKERAAQARIEAEQAAEREREVAAQRAREAEAAAARQAEEEKERLERERAAATAIVKDVTTVGYEYVIVIASYSQNNRYAKSYLEEIRKTYSDAAIFRSEKRKLDYVYVGGYETIEPALARMDEIRGNTEFKDAWVHIIRLSRQ